ncbi:hypothetical protein FDI21_gp181 [Pseudomonas phage Noxifer]|uniref:Uncharacterized protein n=1 Tax=Pseudomonas phage Noxifer TaxID=2006684 RepID=A0A1Y0SVB3_9CAUD|nr:hypothetical protein FDI21_gp181 [Pseudomonas phage Noxifer]ARV77350.1 hypothetical protein NOXIFER_181 [Pseudomonas phage Noxifer]
MSFKQTVQSTTADVKVIGKATLQGVGQGIKIGVAFLPITIALYVISRI